MPSGDSYGTRAAAIAGGTFPGRFSDGQLAITHEARVALLSTGLVISARDLRGPIVWPYDRLRSVQPLRPGKDVLLTNSGDASASLFITATNFAGALAPLAPHLTRSGRLRRRLAPWLAAFAVVASVVALIAALNLSPARAVAGFLPERARAALGRHVITSMTQGRRVCAETAGRAALDRLAVRLSAGAREAGHDKHYRIIVADWPLMNAFAVPGEQIVLTSGLIAKAESADELAGVLAHEMGHGLALHPETSIVRSIGLVAAAELVFGSGTLTNVGVQLAQLTYSRAAEHEADMLGLALLRQAAISPKGLLDFFSRVEKIESGRSLKGFDVLRSHPATAERKLLVAGQAGYPSTPALSPQDWAALKAICPAAPGFVPGAAKPRSEE